MESSDSETVESDPIQSLYLMDKNIDDSDRNILISLTLKCKEEMKNNCLQKPLDDYTGRVSYYTGLPKAYINLNITKDLEDIVHKDKYFELSDRINMFEYISILYANNKNLTYQSLFRWYTTLNPTVTITQFHYMLRCIGFEYHKTKLGKEVLMEDPSLTFERFLYLKKLNNFRSECAPIYYIDERFLDSTFSLSKPWVKDIDISSPACDGYVFFHAISKQGFLNGLFCSPATKQDFLKWISHILLPLLSEPSVIIMDKNDLHGSLINTITKYDSQSDMLQYLRQRNIPCSEYLHKAELYKLISKCSVDDECYDVDEIFKAHGHYVLRLPANFHDLSLSSFLWKHVLDTQPDLFTNIELSQVKLRLLEQLSCLPQTIWDTLHEELLEAEKKIFMLDAKIYKTLDNKPDT